MGLFKLGLSMTGPAQLKADFGETGPDDIICGRSLSDLVRFFWW